MNELSKMLSQSESEHVVEPKSWMMEEWLSRDQGSGLDYFSYWNDEEEESAKEWNILDGNFEKMESYLREKQLPNDLLKCLEIAKNAGHERKGGIGLDLAAGNLWAAPYLINHANLDRLYCLEFSHHRIMKLGPKVLENYHVPQEKIVLVHGSFYEIRLPAESVDLIFLSQAFHHADDPLQLLAEMKRVLKPDGIIIIIGEHIVSCTKAYIKHLAKLFLGHLLTPKAQEKIFGRYFYEKGFFPSLRQLFPVDEIKGDHHYPVFEYRRMFREIGGFKVQHIKNTTSRYYSFVLTNK